MFPELHLGYLGALGYLGYLGALGSGNPRLRRKTVTATPSSCYRLLLQGQTRASFAMATTSIACCKGHQIDGFSN